LLGSVKQKIADCAKKLWQSAFMCPILAWKILSHSHK